MSLEKLVYVDNQTVIHAEQLNAIQDAIIENEDNIADLDTRINNIPSAAPAQESTDYPGCYYRTVNGVQEWVNPPMALGVEYQTTERFNGKPVFTKLVDCGTLVEGVNAIKYYDTIYAFAFKVCGKLFDSGIVRTLPYDSAEITSTYQCHLRAAAGSISLHCGSNLAGRTAQVQVWYTKEN